MKLAKFFAQLALVVMVVVLCSSWSLFGSKKKTMLVMATNAEFPPYESIGPDGKFTGIDVDMMEAIAKKLGYTLKVENIEFDSVIPAVNSGKADCGVAGMTVTEDRKKNVDFTDTYMKAYQVIIVKKGSAIKSADDLKGVRIGVQQGTTGDDVAAKLTDKMNRFNKGSEAVMSLMQDKVDAVVIDNEPAKAFVRKNADTLVILDKPLTDEEYAIALKKGNTELLKKINQALKELKASGELDKIFAKYFDAE